MRDSTESVAVFWDLDTCSIHPSTSGYDVVGKIRSLSQTLGTVRSFKGYADLANLGIPSALHLRSELQSSGVSLIDCPATGQSISSKTMIVDILAHAADNPPPTTLLVIAGNDDFSYAVSILQLRQYQVVLVCPKDRVGQHSQASLYLDWFRDVLGSDFATDDDPQPSRGSRRSRSNTTGTVSTVRRVPTLSQDRGVATPEPLASGPSFSHSTRSSIGSIFHENSGDRIPHYPHVVDEKNEEETRNAEASVEVVPPATVDDIPQLQKNETRMDSPVPSIFVDIQQRPLSAPPSYESFSPAPSPSSQDLYGLMQPGAFRPPRYSQDRTYDSEVGDDFEDPDRLISQPQSPGSTSASTITPWNRTHTPNSPTTSTPLPASRARLSPDLSRVAVLPRTSQGNPESPSPSSFSMLPSLVQTPNFSPRIIPDSIRPSSPETPFEVPLTSVSLRGPQTIPATPLPQYTSTPSPAPFATSQSASMSLPTRGLTPVSARVPTPAPAPIPAPAATSPPVPSGSTPRSAPTKPPIQVRPPAPKVVPPQFKQLVKKLQECRNKGDLKPFRPGLAAEMVSVLNKEIQEAGVSTFTQFAQLAEQAGVVELPRPGEGLWIALRPELYNYLVQ